MVFRLLICVWVFFAVGVAIFYVTTGVKESVWSVLSAILPVVNIIMFFKMAYISIRKSYREGSLKRFISETSIKDNEVTDNKKSELI